MRCLLDGNSGLSVYPAEVSGFLEMFLEQSGYASTIEIAQSSGALLQQFLPEQDDLATWNELKERMVKAFDAKGRRTAPELLEALTAAKGLTLLDVTTPNLAGYLDVFQGSKVIHMIRHPFDTLNSQFRLRFADPNSFGGSHPGHWPFTDAFERVQRSFAAAARYQDHERVKLVRLEDLQSNPKKVMADVMDFLDLQLEPINLGQTKDGKDFAGNSTRTPAMNVVKQNHDWSCLTKNDLSLASRLPHVGEFYDIPHFPTCKNQIGPFLARTFGFKGKERPTLRSPKKFLQLIPISLSHYMQDLAYKAALESELKE